MTNKMELKRQVLAFFLTPNKSAACSLTNYSSEQVKEMIEALEVTGELDHVRNETHKVYRTSDMGKSFLG